MEQVLIRSDGPFAHDDATGLTGLNQLQLWHSEKGGQLALFSVTDRPLAQEWLQTQIGLGHISTVEYLTTA